MELGLIEEIGGLSDALACLHKMIEQRNQEKTEEFGIVRRPNQPPQEGVDGKPGRETRSERLGRR